MIEYRRKFGRRNGGGGIRIIEHTVSGGNIPRNGGSLGKREAPCECYSTTCGQMAKRWLYGEIK